MSNCLVSVVVPNYNYENYLEGTIAAIQKQTYTNFEVIVVDDGSQDGSFELISEKFPQVRLYRQENRGVNSARNLGISLSKGELVALCDADDLWVPTKLEKQVPLFSNSNTVLVGSHVVEFDEDTNKLSIVMATNKGDLSKAYRRSPGKAWMPGACSSSIFRRSAAKEVGLFDEGLRGSAEDWEFFMRMARSGDFDFVDEVLVQIRKHKSSRSTVKPLIWLRDNNKALNQGFKKTPEYGSFGLLRSKAYLLHVFTRSLLRKWLLKFISVSNGTSDK